jgi:hypothetical protein
MNLRLRCIRRASLFECDRVCAVSAAHRASLYECGRDEVLPDVREPADGAGGRGGAAPVCVCDVPLRAPHRAPGLSGHSQTCMAGHVRGGGAPRAADLGAGACARSTRRRCGSRRKRSTTCSAARARGTMSTPQTVRVPPASARVAHTHRVLTDPAPPSQRRARVAATSGPTLCRSKSAQRTNPCRPFTNVRAVSTRGGRDEPQVRVCMCVYRGATCVALRRPLRGRAGHWGSGPCTDSVGGWKRTALRTAEPQRGGGG